MRETLLQVLCCPREGQELSLADRLRPPNGFVGCRINQGQIFSGKPLAVEVVLRTPIQDVSHIRPPAGRRRYPIRTFQQFLAALHPAPLLRRRQQRPVRLFLHPHHTLRRHLLLLALADQEDVVVPEAQKINPHSLATAPRVNSVLRQIVVVTLAVVDPLVETILLPSGLLPLLRGHRVRLHRPLPIRNRLLRIRASV